MKTKKDLMDFEAEIAALFNSGAIHAPVHLYFGNEDQIIEVFQNVRPQDWIFCSWRSHYQCLLKGVPPTEVKQEILAGRSISLCFPDYRIYSSAIVGGVLPIALGVAMSIKRRGEDSRVYCFLGEMTAETGIAHESMKYSRNFGLPVHFVVEDNGKSVCTNTREAWNVDELSFDGVKNDIVTYYSYESKFPHAGAGQRVQF